MEFEFKKNNNLEKRIKQYEKINKEYPTKIPIIIEKLYNSSLNTITNSKYILSNDLTIAEFMNNIRAQLEINQERALFFLAKGKYIISGNEILRDVYNKYKDSKDGFLYISYSEELVYG